MKVHIDIDCTPEEARVFFGLPDVQPMQEAVMNEMRGPHADPARRHGNPDEDLMPAGIAGMEQLQKMFWQQFGDKNRK